MKLFINRFIAIFVVLFTTSFPIHFDSLLNFPVYFALFWEDINHWILNLFGLSLFSPILSDSKGLYIHVVSLLVISAIISLIWVKFKEQESLRFNYYFYVFVSYYLSLQLLIYGCNKLLLLQFTQPSANLLFTNVGDVSKDLLFWISMGSSPLYSYLTGIIEVFVSILLLSHRTRLLGALFSIGVFLNIVFINFAFDISVKVYSLFLLFLSIYLVSPFFKMLYRFFIKQKFVKLNSYRPVIYSQRLIRINLVIKIFIILFFVYISLKPCLDSFTTDRTTLESTKLSEAYNVLSFKLNGVNSDSSKLDWKRIYFHPNSYFIVEYYNEEFSDYTLQVNLNNKQLVINNKIIFNYQFLKNGNLKLIGLINKQAVVVVLETINSKELPLLNYQFHWIID